MIAVACLILVASGVDVDREVPFGSRAYLDGWGRITATVQTDSKEFKGRLKMTVRGYDMGEGVFERPLTLAPQGRRRVRWDLFLTGAEEEVEVEIFDERGARVARKTRRLSFQQPQPKNVLIVGPESRPLAKAWRRYGLDRTTVLPESFPDDPIPLLAADSIVLIRPEALRLRQVLALEGYLAAGGRLVLFSGREIGPLRQGFWKEVLPMEVTGSTTLDVEEGGKELSIFLVEGRVRDGKPFLPLKGKSLGIRASRGRGEIVFLRFPGDVDLPEEALPPREMWRSILAPERDEEIGWISRSRREPVFVDAPGLLTALEPEGPRFGALPALASLALLLLYVVAIGPFDFLRLRRRGRLKRGWVSFLGHTAGFSAIFVLGGQFLTVPQTSFARITFADEGLVQTFSRIRWGEGREYQVKGEGVLSPLIPYWKTGTGAPQPGWSLSPDSILHLPVALLSEQSIASCRIPEEGELGVSCAWEGPGRQKVRLRNRGSLILHECYLVQKDRVHWLPPLAPGADLSVNLADAAALSFAEWARDLREEKNRSRPPGRRWRDQWEWGDPGAGLFELSFQRRFRQDTRGGVSRHVVKQRRIDLSDVLDRGQAVFAGIYSGGPAPLRVDGTVTERSLGILRVILDD